MRSGKNRFGAKRVLWEDYQGGSVFYVVGCLRAGNNDSALGASVDTIHIDVQGTGNDC